jgi:hypothetical protein
VGWTYTGDPRNSDRDAVRFKVGDTIPKDQLATDEEILYALDEQGSVLLAAVVVAEAIAARFSRLADARVGDVSESASKKAEAYRKLADNLRRDASVTALPVFGGISRDEKRGYDLDDDLVQPSFRVTLDDHPELPNERDQVASRPCRRTTDDC